MGLKKRLFATFYHHTLSGTTSSEYDDDFTLEKRIPLIKQANGTVLEVGAGDGGNLPFYPPGIDLTLLEPNPFMMQYLEREAESVYQPDYQTVLAPAEAIPFEDERFDTVLSTHVLCSVSDLAKSLAEIRRVLKPGGQFLFLEHVAAHPDTSTFTVQKVINPAWRFVGDGCHLTRDTGAAIRAAGFSEVILDTFEAGWPGIVSPHITGRAVR